MIGVLPERFEFFGTDREFFAPLCLTRAQVESRVGGNSIVGRLKPGVSIEQAQAEARLRWRFGSQRTIPRAIVVSACASSR